MHQMGSALAGAGLGWEVEVCSPWDDHVELDSKSWQPPRQSQKREEHRDKDRVLQSTWFYWLTPQPTSFL